MTHHQPVASLSLDLDNKWSYLKTHGDPGWDRYPSYLHLLVPHVLDILGRNKLGVTVFVVGRDAALVDNEEPLRALADAGFEIGNHSFKHEPWLHRYTRAELEAEISLAEEHLERFAGRRPVGFRGPGFSFSPTTLEILARRGYLYDASTFPTFIGPLARAYYFMTARLTREERAQRDALFGSWREGFLPIKPHARPTPAGRLLEIPVTTMPFVRVPMHVSYLLYLSTYSAALAWAYFRTGLALCRLARVEPSLLLHPLDFLGREDERDLGFFPAMELPGGLKRELVEGWLQALANQYRVVTLEEHATRLGGHELRALRPQAGIATPRQATGKVILTR